MSQKNHNFIIEIFDKIHALKPNAYLVLVGNGELENIIRDQVKNKGLERNVIFTGVRSDIPDILSAMDVMLHDAAVEIFSASFDYGSKAYNLGSGSTANHDLRSTVILPFKIVFNTHYFFSLLFYFLLPLSTTSPASILLHFSIRFSPFTIAPRS